MNEGTVLELVTTATQPRAVVLVVHEVPAYRQGVASALREAGLEARDASRFPADDGQWDVCLVAARGGAAKDALAMARRLGRPAVALLAPDAPADYQRSLRDGAIGAVAQDAPVEVIVDAVHAALRGMALLPAGVARAFVDAAVIVPDTVDLPEQVTGWLRALSQGVPIATIARDSGYSERQMYRQMQQVYRRIGARNRGEAIRMAAKWGIDTARPMARSRHGDVRE